MDILNTLERLEEKYTGPEVDYWRTTKNNRRIGFNGPEGKGVPVVGSAYIRDVMTEKPKAKKAKPKKAKRKKAGGKIKADSKSRQSMDKAVARYAGSNKVGGKLKRDEQVAVAKGIVSKSKSSEGLAKMQATASEAGYKILAKELKKALGESLDCPMFALIESYGCIEVPFLIED